MQTKDRRSQRSNIKAMILLKTVILFYKKRLNFAPAHSPKNSKLYGDILGEKYIRTNFYINFVTSWLPDVLCTHWIMSSVMSLGPNCRYLSLRMSIPWGVRRDSCTHRQQLIETTFFEAAAAVGLLSNVLTTNSLQIPWVLGSSVARVCDQRREGHRFNSFWRFRFFFFVPWLWHVGYIISQFIAVTAKVIQTIGSILIIEGKFTRRVIKPLATYSHWYGSRIIWIPYFLLTRNLFSFCFQL